ncbi:MAG: type II secretion system F family protein [Bryobacteraceae bacterium]
MNPLFWLLPLFFFTVAAAVAAAGYLVLRLQSAPEAPSGYFTPPSASPAAHDLLAALGRLIPNRGGENEERLLKLLFRAGHRSPDARTIFQGIQVAGAVVLAVVFSAVAALRGGDSMLLATLCGAGFGFLLPSRVLEGVVRFRVRRIRSGLPPALDLLVLALEAGQPLDQAMQETAQAIQGVFPELASEFMYCCLEINAGTARGEALYRLGERSGEDELRKVAAVLMDGERFGTPLGPALRAHSHYLRSRMRQGAQEAARKLTVKLVLPVFFLIFPSVLLVTLGPAYFQMRQFLDNFLK